MRNLKVRTKRSLAVVLSLALAAAPIAVGGSADAASAPTLAKKASIVAGKSKKLTIKKSSFKIKKVTAKTSAKKVATVKATKKAITIKALKKGSATITTTILAQKGKKKAKSYKVKTKVTVTAKKATTTATVDKTVTASADLKAALDTVQASAAGGTVTLDTTESGSFEIAEAAYSKVALVVNAPNADIVNSATFKSVTIKAIKAST